ncbi:MAG: hypothetical protein NT075_02090 [Chloroflexi bacterium]|nr:hypothetical protein [Chloroflexota bacterium]
MNEQIEILVTFILYLAFFGWIGWMRGRKREGFTLAVALGSWILLQRFSGIFISLANLGKKFFYLAKAGGLSSNSDTQTAAIGTLKSVPPLLTAENAPGFLFVLWVIILILAYVLSSKAWLSKNNKADGWAVLFGLGSGLLYVTVLLPRLIALVVPGDATSTEIIRTSSALDVLGTTLTLLRTSLVNVWQLVRPQASLIILITLTLLLVLAASTLNRSNARKT